MFIQVFPSGPLFTNAYVAVCERTQNAVIIDPAPDSFLFIRNFIRDRRYTCRSILLTHSHWDHIADAKKLKEEYGVPVYVHRLDAPNLASPGADGLPFRMSIEGVDPDINLEDGMHITIGECDLEVLHTPGHSPGSVCFYESRSGLLLSGDTLFCGAIGNVSFPTSQPRSMGRSLARLLLLPPETEVFPGHGEKTTLAEEAPLLQSLCD